MALQIGALMAFFFVGGVLVTLYYLVQIPIIWVKHKMWMRLFERDPEEAHRRLMAEIQRGSR